MPLEAVRLFQKFLASFCLWFRFVVVETNHEENFSARFRNIVARSFWNRWDAA